jgi:hypothetical protein
LEPPGPPHFLMAEPPSAASAATGKDFDALLRSVLDNPDLASSPSITDEEAEELLRRLRPHASLIGEPPAEGRRALLACSYTNLREDYLRRFLMTSLVGFLFQALAEWEVPEERRRWKPARQKAAPAAFTAAELVERLEAVLEVARQAALRSAAAPAGPDQPSPGPAPAEQPGPDPAAAAALTYTATHLLSKLGADAAARLRPAWAAAGRFETAREVLEKYPVPAPPSEQTTPAAVAKAAIEDFLKNWLQFDPSIHVRSARDAKALEEDLAPAGAKDVKGAEGRPLESSQSPAGPPEHAKHLAALREAGLEAATLTLLRDPVAAAAVAAAQAAPEAFRASLEAPPAGDPARPAADHVPPQDTFHRWRFYTDSNFERLRAVTHALYPERPELDFALAPWQVIEGPAAEVDARFEEFCRRWEDRTPSPIFSIEIGRGWTMMGEFAKNRERVNFYNRNTDVLERIIRRHEDDQKIGAQMMKKRIQVQKAANIRSDGPDAKGLASYRRNQGGLEKLGAQRLAPEEMARLEEAKGSLKRAEELRLLSEYRKTIKELGALEAKGERPLSFDEARNLKIARDHLARAEEMAAVPPGAVQVDVFRTDGRSGEFSRSHFYTEADEPEAPPQEAERAGREAERAERARSLHPLAGRAAGPAPAADGGRERKYAT